MQLWTAPAGHTTALKDLFTRTFTASEGADEGALIGTLVQGLLADTPPADLRVFAVPDGEEAAAAVLFTRLRYAGDPRRVMLLSPMAVAPDRQGQGLGQALLTEALARLRAEGFEGAITYGDPAFYGKLGFRPLSPQMAPPPHPLSQPEGWIGQSLTDTPLTPLQGPATCAPALDDPAYW
ncbi:GNAT family N-acetyltransferase [Pseudoponticoccus marisrubri]|uniref:Acetyltransferase n=1 Tax=Pseudoponticoccus marisrubri TaxID=1685382 RepID=A0A0W7WH39_9RHOB|nr:N-acetyltransferase [Pseudoponticoccus marisrubri]KUF09914.1 acetyltransferase [Pseudoponticoccus marisrubri]